MGDLTLTLWPKRTFRVCVTKKYIQLWTRLNQRLRQCLQEDNPVGTVCLCIRPTLGKLFPHVDKMVASSARPDIFSKPLTGSGLLVPSASKTVLRAKSPWCVVNPTDPEHSGEMGEK